MKKKEREKKSKALDIYIFPFEKKKINSVLDNNKKALNLRVTRKEIPCLISTIPRILRLR